MRDLVARCAAGLVGGANETPQFLMVGLDGAGKTTLLYRLKLGQAWKEIKEDMEAMRKKNAKGETEDPGYHYEELSFPRYFSAGIWEVPGTEPMRRMWSAFYHAIKIHGVIFVVDGRETDEARIEVAKKHLHFLMNEDELRNAAFCVVVNMKELPKSGSKAAAKPAAGKEDELEYRLGLHRIHETCKWRTRIFRMNVLDLKGESDKSWLEVMAFMRTTLTDPKGYGIKL
mmetsp:Transcript_20046/g.62624  ORF Transcript_20046/g.62624 Transcript_20046/m.62624 type:complete len:229 (+) Transcript_20046:3-689(+)